MTRRWPCIVVTALCCLFVACEKAEKPKPLAERILDKMIERCKVMERTDRKGECEKAVAGSGLDAINGPHRVMVKQATDLFPSDGVCSKHGSFLVCTEKTLDGKSRGVLYRLSSAKDGSDTEILSVWSQEW
jgi:hypothetical protein